MATLVQPSLRIDIDVDDAPAHSSPLSDALRERLEAPAKTPRSLDKALNERNARNELLHKLEIEAIQARARRANERVKENAQRKLRLQAAKVARAEAKIDKANAASCARLEERNAARAASASRRAAAAEAVREAREEQERSREARKATRTEVEARAQEQREKLLRATVERSAAAVKRARQVVASQRVKEETAIATAAEKLKARLEAAHSRRQDKISATSTAALKTVQAAERARLRHESNLQSATEGRRVQMARMMEEALARRAAAIGEITTRAAAENARVADVVACTHAALQAKPAALRRELIGRMQAAEVSRLIEMRSRVMAASSRLKALAHGKTTEPAARATAGGAAEIAPKQYIKWFGPEGGAGRERPDGVAPPRVQSANAPKTAQAIVISTDDCAAKSRAPSDALLSRLLFRPRILLATAAARHAAAAGRRDTSRSLVKARAHYLGTVRVAVVKGRRAGWLELHRSLCELRCRKAERTAAEAIAAKRERAASMSSRVSAALLRRSALRLTLLNGAMKQEEARQAAAARRDERLDIMRCGRWRRAMAAAAASRREDGAARRAARGAALVRRCLVAEAFRGATLSLVASKAKMSSVPHSTPVKLAMREGLEVAAVVDPPSPTVDAPPPLATEEQAATEEKAQVDEKAAAEEKAAADLDMRIAAQNADMARTQLRSRAMAEFAKLSAAADPKGAHADAYSKWRLLERRMLHLAASGTGLEQSTAEERAAAVRKAAAVSAAAAVKAEAKAEAKTTAAIAKTA